VARRVALGTEEPDVHVVVVSLLVADDAQLLALGLGVLEDLREEIDAEVAVLEVVVERLLDVTSRLPLTLTNCLGATSVK
jgi:hypothetical protein